MRFTIASIVCTLVVVLLWMTDSHYRLAGLPVGGDRGSWLLLAIAVVTGLIGAVVAAFDRRRPFHLRVLSIYVAMFPLLLVVLLVLLVAALSGIND